LTGKTAFRYGFNNTHFNAIAKTSYHHFSRDWLTKGWELGVEGGKYVFQYNPQNPIPELYNTITTLFYNQNYMKIYERWEGALFFKKNYGNGLKWDVKTSFQQRLPLENTTTYSWKSGGDVDFTPNIPKSLQGVLWEQHNAILAEGNISYMPGFTYSKYPEYTMPHAGKWPTFTLHYEKGIPGLLSSKTDFDKWRFGIEQAISLKILGALSYNMGIGGFLNKNYVSLPDMMHLYDNSVGALPPGLYLHGFELAPYYQYSNTENMYYEAHVEYNLLGLLTNKIPLLRQARWYALIGTNAFYANANDYYTEAFIGIDNIGFKIMRGIRVDFVKSWDNNNISNTAIRIGLKFASSVTVSTSNGEEW